MTDLAGRRAWTGKDGITYEPGARFRVLRPLLLVGAVYAGRSAWDGWSQRVAPGDIITCTGYGPGWGADPGYGVEWTTGEAQAAGACHVSTSPAAGGAYGYRPPPGYVEPAGDTTTTGDSDD